MPRVSKKTIEAKAISIDHEMMGKIDLVVNHALVLQGEWLRRSFHRFVEAAWPIIEPGSKFSDNWHVHAICDHLEAVSQGKIHRLIINMPPRFAKSSLVSVLWPVWVWISKPETKFLTSSFSKDLATRDSVAARRLMESDWFKLRYSHIFKFIVYDKGH